MSTFPFRISSTSATPRPWNHQRSSAAAARAPVLLPARFCPARRPPECCPCHRGCTTTVPPAVPGRCHRPRRRSRHGRLGGRDAAARRHSSSSRAATARAPHWEAGLPAATARYNHPGVCRRAATGTSGSADRGGAAARQCRPGPAGPAQQTAQNAESASGQAAASCRRQPCIPLVGQVGAVPPTHPRHAPPGWGGLGGGAGGGVSVSTYP